MLKITNYLVDNMRGSYQLDKKPDERLKAFRAHLVAAAPLASHPLNYRDGQATIQAIDKVLADRAAS